MLFGDAMASQRYKHAIFFPPGKNASQIPHLTHEDHTPFKKAKPQGRRRPRGSVRLFADSDYCAAGAVLFNTRVALLPGEPPSMVKVPVCSGVFAVPRKTTLMRQELPVLIMVATH